MNHPAFRELINDCFESTNFMALSTYGNDGLWCNPVYFAWDNDFNVYFISELDCRHMRNIQSSPEIACAVFPTNQDNDVFGAYLKGHPDWEIADKTYYDRVYPNDPNWELRNAPSCWRQKESWHLVKIKMSELSYFDTRYFEENRIEISLEELSKESKQ